MEPALGDDNNNNNNDDDDDDNNNDDFNSGTPAVLPPAAAPLPPPLNYNTSSSKHYHNSISSSLGGGGGGGGGSSIIVNGEKTVPFLRQLTQMLRNNTELISFVPGRSSASTLSSTTTTTTSAVVAHGQIIIHDRRRVQNEVLPIYFNHASFASLRRQLSYFSFVRVGKGRQQAGVIYTNENVVELEDICKLRRRRSGGGGSGGGGGGAAGGERVAELKDGGVVRERVTGEENVDQGWEGGEELHDGINVAPLAIPTDAVASLGADHVLLPPCSVDDSNDYDHIASAMQSGTLHAANDNNCHTDQGAAGCGENNFRSSSGRNTTTATQLSLSQNFSGGGTTSGDEDEDDDDVSYPLPQSTFSSSNQKVCGQQQPLTTASLMQKKKTTTTMKQVHHPHHPFLPQHRHHPNWRQLPMTLPSSSPSSIAVNNNSSSNNSGGSNSSSSDTAITNTNIHCHNKPSNSNNSKRHRCSSVVVPAKDRARFHRLLSINSIVPFIHLPTPASSSSSSSLMNAALIPASVANAKGVAREGKEGGIKIKRNAATRSYQENVSYDDDKITAPPAPKKSKAAPPSTTAPLTQSNRRSTTRERSSSDCVVTALLALGADRQ